MRAIAPCILAALAVAACSNAPEGAADNAGPASTDAAAMASSVSYRCDDGSMLQVDYGDADASIRWADGRSVDLPRAESASGGGGDAYVGTDVSLQRTGTGIELHDGDAPMRSCTEVPVEDGAAGAAAPADEEGVTMRYACDADTRVTVFDDGTARVDLPRGQTVKVSRIAGSTPPVFTGDSIYFTVGENDARLSQDDAAGELACSPA
ncbi:MAG TPA: MliC family protein [Luteimonas sp.]|nr:MliC family protein [Luteimonas sp.]